MTNRFFEKIFSAFPGKVFGGKFVSKTCLPRGSVEQYEHRDRSIHIEIECLAVVLFVKLGCFVIQNTNILSSLLLNI